MSCPASVPTVADLARLAGTFARAGIDVVKDDHGLADQASAPLAQRIAACARAIDAANAATGHRTCYAPSLTGSLDDLRRGIDLARHCGVRMALVAPMVSGVSALAVLARESGIALLAHPALAGSAKIAPPLLLGKLFRLFGADATIFPHTGGRFGYTLGECARIADAARLPWHHVPATMPVPAGGMTVERVPGLRELYGDDVMFLIGGSLLAADDVEARCRAFAAAVRDGRSNVPNT
jgi:ribulose-bisphosphate carboxylase large chain